MSNDGYLILDDGYCTTFSYVKTKDIFKRVSGSEIDRVKSADLFGKIATAMNLLGRQPNLYKGNNFCAAGAGKVPCHLLSMPSDELPCQLVRRMKNLYDFVSESCNAKFARKYQRIMDNLMLVSLPRNGKQCPQSDSIHSRFSGIMLKSAKSTSPKVKSQKTNVPAIPRRFCSLEGRIGDNADGFFKFGLEKISETMELEGHEKQQINRISRRYGSLIKVS